MSHGLSQPRPAKSRQQGVHKACADDDMKHLQLHKEAAYQ